MLQDRASDPLHGLFKIRPNERREFGVIPRSVECKAPSSVRDCFKVSGREVSEPVGERGNTSVWSNSHAIEALVEQTLAPRTAR